MNKKKTTLLIRPAARGGKYLGHDAANADGHSALVAILDPRTGKPVAGCLARAPSAQSAGPKNLMDPVSRAEPYAADQNTVSVALSVDIDAPTDFRVVVYGPLSFPDQARMAQADITVLPGVDVGMTPGFPEGLVIEVPGLCISGVKAQLQGAQLACSAKVTMMCGCQIHAAQTGWPWPASAFSIQLVTAMRSGAVHSYPMAYDTASPVPSVFSGKWANQGAGDTLERAWIYASEPKLGNQGAYWIQPAQPPQWPLAPELEAILASKQGCPSA